MHGFLTYMAVIVGGALGGTARFTLTLFVPDHEWLGLYWLMYQAVFLWDGLYRR
ncbi:hypothetical protein JCM19047_2150 [Bacillus sp. JCM 19047]|nr:hypothetical protein JCM19047_2150 [Bacillus sp. JCM 19047]